MSNYGGWQLLDDALGGEREHVVPIRDLRGHDLAAGCWCRPVQSEGDPRTWLHNAADGREAFERGERKVS